MKQPPPKEQQTAEVHKSSYKSLEVGASRPSPGSVGKLRISNEMKHKLEMVTANHSLRSTTSKPRPQAMNNMPTPPAGKLDTDRRLLLQQQLGEFFFENCNPMQRDKCQSIFYEQKNQTLFRID